MKVASLAKALGFVDHVTALEDVVGEPRSLLDVGCGNNSPIARFSRRIPHTVGLDKFEPWLEESRERGIHDQYVLGDVVAIEREFGERAFDVVLACDVLEHLRYAHADELLSMMERVAGERVVVLTPNGFVPQAATWGNPHQVHRSGWSVRALEERGYALRGVNGLKALRGERGTLRLRPARVWEHVSRATQPIGWRRPAWAFHLLAVKEIGHHQP